MAGTSEREKALEGLLQRILGRLDPAPGCIAEIGDGDLALGGNASNRIMERVEGYAMAAEALWDAYYAPGRDPQDVDWSDIQAALVFAVAATGRGEPDFVPGCEKALVSVFLGRKLLGMIDITDEVVRLDAASLSTLIADPSLGFGHDALARKLDGSKMDGLRLVTQDVVDFLGTETPDDELMEAVRKRFGVTDAEMLDPIDGVGSARPPSPAPSGS